MGELLPVIMATLTAVTASIASNVRSTAGPSTAATMLLPAPQTPRSLKRTASESLLSPAPLRRMEIPSFLEDYIIFFEGRSLEDAQEVFSGREIPEIATRLKDYDLTPDILNDIPDDRLTQLLSLPLGTVVKLKKYAVKWVERLDRKRRRGSPEI